MTNEGRKDLAEWYDLKSESLKSLCINSSFNISSICSEHQLECYKFMCSEDLSPGVFHCFNIVKFRIPSLYVPGVI